MGWTTPRTWVTGEVLTKANLDTQIRDNLNYLKVTFPSIAAVELTISAGTVARSYYHHTIDTQSDAATDDLDTVNGGEEGQFLFLRPASGDRTVVLKHNTGNIWSPHGMDLSLEDADDYAFLVYSGSKWCIIGAGGGSFTNLNDVPATYLDQGGKAVVVKGDETGLEFVELASTSHAATHKDGGSDELLLHELGQPTAPVNFNLQEADNFCVEELNTEPALSAGRIYRDSSTSKLYYCKEDQ